MDIPSRNSRAVFAFCWTDRGKPETKKRVLLDILLKNTMLKYPLLSDSLTSDNIVQVYVSALYVAKTGLFLVGLSRYWVIPFGQLFLRWGWSFFRFYGWSLKFGFVNCWSLFRLLFL